MGDMAQIIPTAQLYGQKLTSGWGNCSRKRHNSGIEKLAVVYRYIPGNMDEGCLLVSAFKMPMVGLGV